MLMAAALANRWAAQFFCKSKSFYSATQLESFVGDLVKGLGQWLLNRTASLNQMRFGTMRL